LESFDSGDRTGNPGGEKTHHRRIDVFVCIAPICGSPGYAATESDDKLGMGWRFDSAVWSDIIDGFNIRVG